MLSRPTPLSAIILVVGIACNSSTVCFAQSGRQPAWTDFTTTTVKPDMAREFERCLKELESAYKQAGALWFLTFETVAGNTTEYTTVVPLMKFGDLDGPSVITKALGASGWERLSHKMTHCYTMQTREYATPQLDVEIRAADVPLGIYWVQTNTSVTPGKMAEYLNWLKNDYRPALEKAGVARFQVSRPIFGAEAGEILTMRMLKNLAEIDAGTVLSRALSDEEAREIAAKCLPLVSSSNTKIVRMRTDLSYSERW